MHPLCNRTLGGSHRDPISVGLRRPSTASALARPIGSPASSGPLLLRVKLGAAGSWLLGLVAATLFRHRARLEQTAETAGSGGMMARARLD